MRIISFIFLAFISLAPLAYAEGSLVALGQPERSNLSPVSNEDVIDIYKRQIAYRDTSLEFRRILIERQESFAVVQRQAHEEYRTALEAMNATREDVQGETR